MSAKFLVFLAAGIAASSFSLAGAKAENICEREMHRASARYDVPLGILYAVGLTETGRKNSLQPYAMNADQSLLSFQRISVCRRDAATKPQC